jgi:hypothetical protein
MDLRPLQRTHLFAAVVFVAAVLVLAVQLITPSPVMVSVGETGAETTTVGQYFTYSEVAVVAVAAVVCGASGTYLLVGARTDPDPPRSPVEDARPQPIANGGVEPDPPRGGDGGATPEERWQETLDGLANNQATIYELLIEADGELPQRTLVEETDLSKATVSRTLDKLEHRGLVERTRDGLGNTVRLT